jgi:hypothetical protein
VHLSQTNRRFSQLSLACFLGNPGATHSLLDYGAEVQKTNGLYSPLDIAISVARRPKISLGWKCDFYDEAVYNWRLDMEDITLALLDKGYPGHERTKLHAVVELGNYRRVAELVEQYRLGIYATDRAKLPPAAHLEDIGSLETNGENKSYIENLREILVYSAEGKITCTCGPSFN